MVRKAPSSPATASAEAALEITRAQAVRLLGVSVTTFSRLEAEGAVVPLRRGAGQRGAIYDAPALVAGYIAHRERRTGALDLAAERAALARAQRVKVEAENRLRAGELLEADQVDEAMAEVDLAVREAVLGVASTAVSSGLVAAGQEVALAGLLGDALRALAKRAA